MKSLRWTKAISLVSCLLPCLYSTGAVAEMPRGEYACQVVAEGGRIGLVVVRADSLEQAERAVIGASAYTTDTVRRPATEVIQCIQRGEERFSDYQFQQFYEIVPR